MRIVNKQSGVYALSLQELNHNKQLFVVIFYKRTKSALFYAINSL